MLNLVMKMVDKKDRYKYVRVETGGDIIRVSEEGELYISESMRKANLFNENKKEQLKLIEESSLVIKSLLDNLKKLDVLLHDKAI